MFPLVDLEVYLLHLFQRASGLGGARFVCAQPLWGRCSGVGTGSDLPKGPSGGAAVCARLCPAAAVCGEGQDGVLARRDRCAQRSPLRGLLLLLPPYGTVGKGVSRADPGFTPQLFLSLNLNSKRSAEKREDAALCVWSTSLAALGFAWILWYCSKRIPQERSHVGDKSLCLRLLKKERGGERKHFALPFFFRVAAFVG